MREISAQAIYNRLKDTTIITQADKDDLKTLLMMEPPPYPHDKLNESIERYFMSMGWC